MPYVTLLDAAVFVTVIVQESVLPWVKFPECVLFTDRTGAGRTAVVSVPVLDKVKPPPEIATELTTDAGALADTSTVRVILG